MMEEEQLNNTFVSATTTTTLTLINEEEPSSIQTKPDSHDDEFMFFDDDDDDDDADDDDNDIDSSSCSTPFVSAPSSPARGQPLTSGPAFFYSAPSSPMHFILSSSSSSSSSSSTLMPKFSELSISTSYDFEFSARFGTVGTVYGGRGGAEGSMSSADELFLNGQIRPMKLSSHLQRPQALEPLLDLEGDDGVNDEVIGGRGIDVKWRDRSLRRRARSMSPLRTQAFHWHHDDDDDDDDDDRNDNDEKTEEISEAVESKDGEPVLGETRTPSMCASSSRSSSAKRNSKRWIFLKDLLLYRSKSEGRNNGHKFWSSISFSPVKDRKAASSEEKIKKECAKVKQTTTTTTTRTGASKKKAASGGGKRRVPLSPHEVHYKASRAQAEEMRKKTYLPYRQGLLGCLGFSSKSYGAMNGFAKALNPVSSS